MLVVPEKLFDEYSVFMRKAYEELVNVNMVGIREQSRCVYCWVALSTNDIEQVEQVTQLILSADFHLCLYPFDRELGMLCVDCEGRLPMGRHPTCKFAHLF